MRKHISIILTLFSLLCPFWNNLTAQSVVCGILKNVPTQLPLLAEVSIIDSNTNQIQAIIELPPIFDPTDSTEVFNIAISPDNTKAYVTTLEFGLTSSEYFIYVIDLLQNKLVTFIPTSNLNKMLYTAFSPDSKTAYVTTAVGIDVITNQLGITVINTATNQITSFIPIVSASPSAQLAIEGITVYPDGSKASVCIYGFDSNIGGILIIDLQNLTPIAAFNTPGEPNYVVLNKDGSTGYVLSCQNQTTSFITVFNPANFTVITNIEIGPGYYSISSFESRNIPPNFALSPDGTRIYAPILFASSTAGISVINTASNTVIDGIIVPPQPGVPEPLSPGQVVITPDNTKVYMAILGTGNPKTFIFPFGQFLSILDTSSLTFVNNSVNSGGFIPFAMGITTNSIINQLPPPTNFKGKVLTVNFLDQTEYIHKLTFGPSPSTNVTNYLLFRNGKLIANIGPKGPFVFLDHNRRKKVKDVYLLFAVGNIANKEIVSSPVKVILPKKKRSGR